MGLYRVIRLALVPLIFSSHFRSDFSCSFELQAKSKTETQVITPAI
jgi:hypothetical protein